MRLLLAVLLVLLTAGAAWGQCANTATPDPRQGHGAATTGGAGQSVYTVTSTADSGAGSLRAGVDQATNSYSGLCVQFSVSSLTLSSAINVRGVNLTIDGWASPTGVVDITSTGDGGFIFGSGDGNVLMRGIRFTGSTGSARVLISCLIGATGPFAFHHLSLRTNDDDLIGQSCPNTTVSWSILYNPNAAHSTAIIGADNAGAPGPWTFHHNFCVGTRRRCAYMANFNTSTSPVAPAGFLQLDFRGNLLWDMAGSASTRDCGFSIGSGATANIVGNYVDTNDNCAGNVDCERRAFCICRSVNLPEDGPACNTPGALICLATSGNCASGPVYTADNVSSVSQTAYLNGKGTTTTEWTVPDPNKVTTTSGCQAAYDVRRSAGARTTQGQLDSVDAALIAALPTTFANCPPEPPIPPPPSGAFFFEDLFTGSGLLTAHVPNIGTGWTELTDPSTTQAWALSGTGSTGPNVAANNTRTLYCAAPGPTLAEYDVLVELAGVPAITGQDDPLAITWGTTDATHHYFLTLFPATANSARLGYANGATSTNLVAATNISWAANDTVKIEKRATGTTVSYTRANVTTAILSTNDATLTSLGQVCIGAGNVDFTNRPADDIVTAWQVKSVRVQLAVTSPILAVTPPALNFTAAVGSNPPAGALTINNTGGGTMTWTAAGTAGVSIAPASGTGSTVTTVTINTAGLPAGTHQLSVTVTAPGVTGSPVTVPITLDLVPTTNPNSNRSGRFR